MAASYSIRGDSFSSSAPHAWSPTVVRRNGVQQSSDVTPDGKRVVTLPMPPSKERAGNVHATFLFNFFDELTRRAPAARR
jgi:hypothetical protein